MSAPRWQVLRMHMSHLVHHRAQLGVYLRLLDVPVPSMYEPTAAEGVGRPRAQTTRYASFGARG